MGDEGSLRTELIGQLADELDMPVISVVSGWHGNHLVNLGEEAVRAFVEVLDCELAARDDEPEAIALFLVGRGGFAAFAEGVWRALGGRKLDVTAVVPYQADGAFTLLGLAADRCVLHPYAGLGAYDRRPLGRLKPRLDSEVVRAMDGLSELMGAKGGRLAEIACERRQAQLASALMERIVGGSDSGLGARVRRSLNAQALGTDLALSAAELARVGLSCQLAEGRLSQLIWDLYGRYEQELEVLDPPMPRYTKSEVAGEVEFEPAMGLSGAFIEGVKRQLRYELDTGSPDADTNMLAGEWLWQGSDEIELGFSR